jgi:hypothetical protein
MTTSTEKPNQIIILSIKDDIKNGKVKVRFAFRYSIIETTIDQPSLNEEIINQVQAWEYKEYQSEQEFDLFLKPSIPDILKSLYTEISPKLESLGNYADVELPREFDI